MVILDERAAWDRSYELMGNEQLAGDFRHLSNTIYKSIDWLDHLQDKPIQKDQLTKDVADDIEKAIRTSIRHDEHFNTAVAEAMPAIRQRIAEYVSSRIHNNAFTGPGHRLRNFIAANTIDVVAQHLKV